MKWQVYLSIATRIVILCGIAMAFTYVPNHLRPFFDDVAQRCSDRDMVDECWDWGIRHYWYQVMTILLLILSIIDAFVWIRRIVLKYYPNI